VIILVKLGAVVLQESMGVQPVLTVPPWVGRIALLPKLWSPSHLHVFGLDDGKLLSANTPILISDQAGCWMRDISSSRIRAGKSLKGCVDGEPRGN
jgi:hypothetical protein